MCARSKNNVCTAQEIFLHGAEAAFPRRERPTPMLGTAYSQGGNGVLAWWEQHDCTEGNTCLEHEKMLFSA